MGTGELTALGAESLARLYRARELSPVEVTRAVLERIDEYEPETHAFFTRTDELARHEAVLSEARFAAGEPLGLMDGIPYSIKDLEPTRGIRTTFGAPATREHVPAVDGAAAGRLRASGGVLLGKTAAPDSGYKDTSETLIFDAPTNPWNRTRTPGGSSGGAAAAVASGFGPVAHGSDGAGSIRIPSSLCGLVGLKATTGRVPVWPQPFYRDTVAHNGPIARSVADVALMLDTLSGPDARDPWSVVANPPSGFHASLRAEATPQNVRIAVSTDFGYGATDQGVASAVVAAAGLLSGLGWSVEHRDPEWEDPAEIQNAWWSTEFAGIFAEALADRPDELEPQLADLVRSGLARLGDGWDFRYRRMRGALHDAQLAFFEDSDYLVTPTMPITAWRPGEFPTGVDGVDFPGGALGRNYLLFPFNLTGNPAITIPCGLSADGMPIGLQIVGRHYDEVGLLRVAQELERLIAFDATPRFDSRE